jgi:pyridoxamine 5'-phosphate oxidase
MDDATSLRARLRRLPTLTGGSPAWRPEEAGSDPATVFVEWIGHAIDAGVREPHVMTLATVDQDGTPDARVLILKDVGDGTWWFASSAESAKGRQLAGQRRAALCFYWPEAGRQVRVRGAVITGDDERRRVDFLERSAGARAVAIGSRMSDSLASQEELDESVDAAMKRLEESPDLVPDAWRVYGVVADSVEFWQADFERNHVRLQYRREEAPAGAHWVRTRLWP